MIEEEVREQYERPELTKLGALKDLTAEECWECQGSFTF
ncbi:MAG: lasso RiPP family leader peptide-containing protein [Thermoleophilia bacterium]